jgi:hypothetical protein
LVPASHRDVARALNAHQAQKQALHINAVAGHLPPLEKLRTGDYTPRGYVGACGERVDFVRNTIA